MKALFVLIFDEILEIGEAVMKQKPTKIVV
jgi:hypothetical protein